VKSRAHPVLAYAAVALAACAWGTWGLIVRRTDPAGAMPSALQSTIVMAVMTAVSGVAALRDRVPGRAPRRARAWVAWLGVSDSFNILLFFAAYKLTITVSVLTHYLTPIFVALAAPLVLRERMTAWTAAAVFASFAGLALMLAPSSGAAPSAVILTSALFGAGSAVFYASNVLVNKLIASHFSTSESMFWHGVVGTPLLAAFVSPSAWSAVDPRAAGLLAVAAIGPGALAGMTFVWGLRRMPAANASTLTLLEPLVSILLAAALLGERLGARAIAGGALILGGAVVVMRQQAGASNPEQVDRAGAEKAR
jgi:drug/metabolite transporter (DMT)-like permease